VGTPGHMAHPFDVERVQTGQDLIDYVNDAVMRLRAGEIAGSVKWEGINASIKLVTNEDGTKEFRMDRGTNEPASVRGFTPEDALKKWEPPHGMGTAVVKVLRIYNSALPSIEGELRELGLWDDPTKYFNQEYIEGQSNVIEYDQNIIAIHGINQFYEKKGQPWRMRQGLHLDRPGLPRPVDADGKPVKSGGIEIPYDHDALLRVIEALQPYAQEEGFVIYGDVSVEFDPEMELNLDEVLQIPVSIQVRPGDIQTASLGEWLQTVEHPQDKRIKKTIRGAGGEVTGEREVGALSKDIYLAVLLSAQEGGIPLSEYLVSEEDIQDAINGGIFYHGTRLLGQAVKNVLTSEAGNLGRHEGVVLRGMEDFLVKLTGDFIVQGLASTHGTHADASGITEGLSKEFTVKVSSTRAITKTLKEWMKEIDQINHKYQKPPEFVYNDILNGVPITEIVQQEFAQEMIYNTILRYTGKLYIEREDEAGDPVVDIDAAPQTVALVPGAFKVPHRGHADMVRAYATGVGVPKADRTIILISNPEGAKRTLPHDDSEVTAEHSRQVWETVFSDVTNLPGVEIQVADSEMRSPVSIAYEYISETTPLDFREGDNVILGASRKNRDYERWRGASEYRNKKQGLNVLAGEEYAVPASERSDGKNFSATDLRQLISNLVVNPEDVESLRQLTEYIPQDKVDELYRILGQPSPVSPEVPEEVEVGLEEISTASNVGGAVGARGGPWSTEAAAIKKDNEEEKEKSKLVTRSLGIAENKQTVDDVIKLLMERGIMT